MNLQLFSIELYMNLKIIYLVTAINGLKFVLCNITNTFTTSLVV